jgi:hypothetical protein
MIQQHFRHLGAAGIARAKYQYGFGCVHDDYRFLSIVVEVLGVLSCSTAALLGSRARRGFGQACVILATVISQEGDQIIHRAEFSRVVDEATFPLSANQPNTAEVRQMKGERSRRKSQFFPDGARK